MRCFFVILQGVNFQLKCFTVHNKSFTQETEDGKTCDKKNPT